ncbi:hypothetical protein, partial [Odoribacter sp. Z80]|uniref:hypothetical protein n=1 Tax=Odoribacter sp. Z80 TaxID=2304575 RepID=UPI00137A79F5
GGEVLPECGGSVRSLCMQVPDRGEQYEQESRVFYHDGGAKRLQYGLFTLQVLVSGQAVC